ncbi:LOB domain-containing protein [Actinidia chinensis var. chinensis]|uniref:LOB domain-containing protein n=1 Tax=Actinidia chinensis var. chinensis TaxID=1590841 RepID=A0A2R6P390_ACTCC|nr:LOB domain-containing protein [Actinidia chinensis var. chinensis]
MRVSCNGCRVLRKGCSENCTIRPCLEWIKTPQSQANATVFLAKFYGRAGLQNLIHAGPDQLRPAIFRSLLYEACGRIVNPIYGSAGLLWSGNWHLCHAAVEAVLAGSPIAQISPDTAGSAMSPPLKACDIRHLSKDETSSASRDLRKVRTRGRFKRAGRKPKAEVERAVDEAAQVIWSWSNEKEAVESASHGSVVSQREEPPGHGGGDSDSASLATVEAKADERVEGSDVELELTLGFEPFVRAEKEVDVMKGGEEIDGSEKAPCEVHLVLHCST